MSPRPIVTVLLPVYEGAAHVREAIDSILTQTLRDVELLVLDDGSTDGTAAILDDYTGRDRRIRVEHLPHRGLVPTLNHGLSTARGHFVARMDADDVSLRERLDRQVAFMNARPDVGLCGAWVSVSSATRANGYVWRTPPDHDRIRCTLLFESALAHPTAMWRRDDAGAALRYDPAYPHAEDYELWVRAAHQTRLANIPAVLLHLRIHPGQVTSRFHDELVASARRVRERQLADLGIAPTDAERDLHEAVSVPVVSATPGDLRRADRWLRRLGEANRATAAYPEPAFAESLREQWLRVCVTAQPKRFGTAARFLTSPLSWPPRGSSRVVREMLWPAARRYASR
jgi:glycosyltransferase involved in cell wall biosynthesis